MANVQIQGQVKLGHVPWNVTVHACQLDIHV